MNIEQIKHRIDVLQKEIAETPISNFSQVDGKYDEITSLRGLLITLNRAAQLTSDVSDLDRAKADLITARNRIAVLEEELRKMTDWKDGAFKTIYEISDEAYGHGWGGGKAQVEIIGQVKHIRETLEAYQKHSINVARSDLDSKLLDHLELHKYSLDCMSRDGEIYWTPDFHRQDWHEFPTAREALTWAMENDR